MEIRENHCIQVVYVWGCINCQLVRNISKIRHIRSFDFHLNQTFLPHTSWALGCSVIQMNPFVWALPGRSSIGLPLSRQLEIQSELVLHWLKNGKAETGAATWVKYAQRNVVLCRSERQDLGSSWKETFCLSAPKHLRLQRHTDGETRRAIFLDDQPGELSREEAR